MFDRFLSPRLGGKVDDCLPILVASRWWRAAPPAASFCKNSGRNPRYRPEPPRHASTEMQRRYHSCWCLRILRKVVRRSLHPVKVNPGVVRLWQNGVQINFQLLEVELGRDVQNKSQLSLAP